MSATMTRFVPRTASAPLLVLILGLPVVFALAGLAAWEFVTSSRQSVELHLSEVARSTALALDAKLTGIEAAGMALAATDDVLESDRLPHAISEAKRIASVLGVHIAVQEAAAPGRVVLNTLLSSAADLPPRDEQPHHEALQSAVRKVVETSRPQVTDIFVGAVTGRRTLAVVLPVVTENQVKRVVILAFPADSLGGWLADQNADTEGFLGIRDGNGLIVASSRNNASFAGRAVPEWSRTLPGDHGTLEGLSLRGKHTLYVYQHLHLAPNFVLVVARPVNGALSMMKGPAKWLMLSILASIVLGMLSLVAIWTRRDSGNAALQEINRLLADVPAVLYVNRVYPDGRFRRRFLSLSAERVTGWSARDLDREGSLAEKIDPAFVAGRTAFFTTALKTGQSEFEYRMRFADGTMHWMRVVGVCLSKESDGSGDILGFITDITEERAIREELRRAERFALLGEVAGRISHEMNQPMAAISMAAENGKLALERTPLNAQQVREKFVRIEQQVQRVVSIIGHITAFSRKGIAADLAELDIAAVIHAALAVAEPKMRAARVSVLLDLPDDLAPPRGVAVLLEQIVVNLIVNACDAYEDQGGTLERIVTIDGHWWNGDCVLRVADRAGGIPADMLANIFDPFVTSKPPGKGTGLGLAFCLASVGRMGGKLTVKNVGGGACFEITLPLAAHVLQPEFAR